MVGSEAMKDISMFESVKRALQALNQVTYFKYAVRPDEGHLISEDCQFIIFYWWNIDYARQTPKQVQTMCMLANIFCFSQECVAWYVSTEESSVFISHECFIPLFLSRLVCQLFLFLLKNASLIGFANDHALYTNYKTHIIKDGSKRLSKRKVMTIEADFIRQHWYVIVPNAEIQV